MLSEPRVSQGSDSLVDGTCEALKRDAIVECAARFARGLRANLKSRPRSQFWLTEWRNAVPLRPRSWDGNEVRVPVVLRKGSGGDIPLGDIDLNRKGQYGWLKWRRRGTHRETGVIHHYILEGNATCWVFIIVMHDTEKSRTWLWRRYRRVKP